MLHLKILQINVKDLLQNSTCEGRVAILDVDSDTCVIPVRFKTSVFITLSKMFVKCVSFIMLK